MSNKVPCGWTVLETENGAPTVVKALEGSLTVEMQKTGRGWFVILQGYDNFYRLIGDFSLREACFEVTRRSIASIENVLFREKELLAKMEAEEKNE
jgi:hypothetical protein